MTEKLFYEARSIHTTYDDYRDFDSALETTKELSLILLELDDVPNARHLTFEILYVSNKISVLPGEMDVAHRVEFYDELDKTVTNLYDAISLYYSTRMNFKRMMMDDTMRVIEDGWSGSKLKMLRGAVMFPFQFVLSAPKALESFPRRAFNLAQLDNNLDKLYELLNRAM